MLMTASKRFSKSWGRWRMSAWRKVGPPLPSAFPPLTGATFSSNAFCLAIASISSLRSTPPLPWAFPPLMVTPPLPSAFPPLTVTPPLPSAFPPLTGATVFV